MSESVPEGLGYMWQVFERGEVAFAEVWEQPHAAAAAAKIESLPLNTLRAIVLSLRLRALLLPLDRAAVALTSRCYDVASLGAGVRCSTRTASRSARRSLSS
jgi:hypothetical protein